MTADSTTKILAETKTRFATLDIMKGFGMFMLMFWHSFSPLAHYFGIFMLAMFLMVSGFTWTEKRTQTWKNVRGFIKKRFKDLMIPYFVYSIIFLSLTNIFIMLKIYPVGESFTSGLFDPDGTMHLSGYFMGLISIFLGLIGSVFTAALWYFYQLFLVYVLHAVVCRIFCKWITTERRRFIFYIILIAVLMLIMQFFHSLEGENLKAVKLLAIRFLSCYVAFNMGIPARMLHDKLDVSNINLLHVILFVATGLLIYVMNGFTTIDLGAGSITSVWSYIVCGILGFVFTYCLSYILDNNKFTKTLANCIAYIGQNTKPIMVYHLICFKPVALIYILICGLSLDKLSQFPVVLDENYTWMWIFYSISGLTLSLLLDKFLNMLKKCITK